ncbi:hypothetical protein F5Y13DRAFT_187011 [Hypoxylon sp. FL1857]|nr:hypothetical protein F5Y13DRAFT_187011 [Hypoxylon sp. FL1857]
MIRAKQHFSEAQALILEYPSTKYLGRELEVIGRMFNNGGFYDTVPVKEKRTMWKAMGGDTSLIQDCQNVMEGVCNENQAQPTKDPNQRGGSSYNAATLHDSPGWTRSPVDCYWLESRIYKRLPLSTQSGVSLTTYEVPES